MDRRRFLLTSLAGAVAPSLTAEAQQAGKVYRIGFLRAGPPPREQVEAFQQGLRARGYIDGRNVVIEYRSTDGSFDELPRLAAELVRFNVDIIVAGGAPAAFAARSATTKVPIVFVHVYDPVEIGLVTSLAHPGETSRFIEARRPEDLDAAFSAMRAGRPEGLVVTPDPMLFSHRARIAALAATHRLPALYQLREHAEAGGLMSYGASRTDLWRRAAVYVDKILKGTKPADLGLTIPPSLLARADLVIE